MRDFNRGRGDREMHDAVCNECGDNCKVPFKPTGNKPIFCSHCFENQGGSDSRRNDRGGDRRDSRRGGRDSFRSNSRDREMHSAVCDECGDNCEIPFKPSTDKPIFCSNCFDIVSFNTDICFMNTSTTLNANRLYVLIGIGKSP